MTYELRPLREDTQDRLRREQQKPENEGRLIEANTGIGKLSGVQHDSILITDPETGLPTKFIYDDQMAEGAHPDDL
jgi:hypothetical protein